MLKILIVEDEREKQLMYHRALGTKVNILSAFTVREAVEHFEANPDIAAIVMDACVPGDSPTTPPIIRRFRETFSGPMIAASSDPDYRKKLLIAGCDHESEKDFVPRKVLEILGIPF